MRVVVDTNVFVSAVLGYALQPLFDHWRAGTFVLVVSDEIVREYLPLGGIRARPLQVVADS